MSRLHLYHILLYFILAGLLIVESPCIIFIWTAIHYNLYLYIVYSLMLNKMLYTYP